MVHRPHSIEVPAEPGSLKRIRAFFQDVLRRESNVDPDPIILALDEACSNVIRHRRGDEGCANIEVQAEVEAHLVRFRIGAFCQQTDLPAVKPKKLEDMREGGRGMSFIEQIMDRVSYVPDPRRPGFVALVLEKELGARA